MPRPVTTASKKLLAEFEEKREALADALSNAEEENSFTRLAIRMRLEAWSEALGMLRANLGYVEEDAVQMAFDRERLLADLQANAA